MGSPTAAGYPLIEGRTRLPPAGRGFCRRIDKLPTTRECLFGQSIQQIGNVPGKRLSCRVAVHLPQFVPDANPQSASKSVLGIIAGDGPFGKEIAFPHSRLLHGTNPGICTIRRANRARLRMVPRIRLASRK